MDADTLTRRIQELKENYQVGQARVQQLEAQRNELQQTLLRISGAIQVLEELRQEQTGSGGADAAPGLHLAR